MNWTVLNDARYCDSYVSVQLVAVNTGAGDDLPSELYSYYEQYVLDAGHLTPNVWVVGIPEPNSVALMLLGVSALIMRRRTA